MLQAGHYENFIFCNFLIFQQILIRFALKLFVCTCLCFQIYLLFVVHFCLRDTCDIFTGIKYNAEKDEKEKQAAKQKKLLALEEAKKLEAEKG